MAKFTLTKEFTFEAAHVLPHHDGKCGRLHGHSWKGKLVLEGEDLQTEGPKQGMLLDFGEIKAAVTPLLEKHLDHHYLNDTTGLESPTSEALAEWIYWELKEKLPLLAAVIVEETCTSSCCYRVEKDYNE